MDDYNLSIFISIKLKVKLNKPRSVKNNSQKKSLDFYQDFILKLYLLKKKNRRLLLCCAHHFQNIRSVFQQHPGEF